MYLVVFFLLTSALTWLSYYQGVTQELNKGRSKLSARRGSYTDLELFDAMIRLAKVHRHSTHLCFSIPWEFAHPCTEKECVRLAIHREKLGDENFSSYFGVTSYSRSEGRSKMKRIVDDSICMCVLKLLWTDLKGGPGYPSHWLKCGSKIVHTRD